MQMPAGTTWLVFCLFSACCALDPRLSTVESHARITLDSAEVRGLIARQGANDEAVVARLRSQPTERARLDMVQDMMAHPERYAPSRQGFFHALGRQPSVAVAPGTYCREIEGSKARCAADALGSSTYVRLLVVSGPSKGVVGWTCAPLMPTEELP
jgi:hypothetical protein